MVARVQFSLKGLDDYLEKVQQAGNDVDDATDRALVAGGDVLLAGMERRVPRLTGNLAANLVRTEPERDGNYHSLEVGILSNVDAETARYGNVQEYGSPKMAAQPYIRPAFDEDKSKARKSQRDSLKQDGII